MLVIRLTAGFFVYLLVFFAILSLLAIGIFLIASDPATDTSASGYSLRQNRVATCIVGAICIVLSVLILIMFICFRNRIKLASNIVKVSARFVS
jgi:hypothetical protein